MLTLFKWTLRLAVLVAVFFGAAFLYFNYIDKSPVLSTTQEETIDTLGPPEQFSVSYLPRASESGSEFIRQESWFYPSMKKKLIFLGGELASSGELEISEDTTYDKTVLKPEDFDFYTSLEQVEKLVGKINLAPVEVPVLFDEEDSIETYASEEAVFIFENGYLTYMETLD